MISSLISRNKSRSCEDNISHVNIDVRCNREDDVDVDVDDDGRVESVDDDDDDFSECTDMGCIPTVWKTSDMRRFL